MRNLILSSLGLLALSSCASMESPSRAPASISNAPWGLRLADLPEPKAIIRWSDPQYEDSHLPALDGLKHVEIPSTCADTKHLYPTHPQQYSKAYHTFRIAIYNQDEVPVQSRVCKLHSNGARPFCELADTFEFAVISDIFQDACGGLYRGVWSVGFLKGDDNMGTLLSKGRTVYPKEGSEFSGDMEDGATYAVDRSEFLFLAPAFPGDKDSAEKLATSDGQLALNTQTHLFEKKH